VKFNIQKLNLYFTRWCDEAFELWQDL